MLLCDIGVYDLKCVATLETELVRFLVRSSAFGLATHFFIIQKEELYMKKVASLLLVLMMAIALWGCDASKDFVMSQNDVLSEEQVVYVEDYDSEVSPTVYRTQTGEKYHREGCYHLKSKIEVTVEDAKDRGLQPCLVCCPPQ